jgi:TPR repeat protein
VHPDEAELREKIQRTVGTITTIITEIQQKFEELLKDRPDPGQFMYKFKATFNNGYAEEDHAIRLEINLINKLFNSIMNPEHTPRPTLESIKTTVKVSLERVSHISKDALHYAMAYKLISEACYEEAFNCLTAVQEKTPLLTILKIQLESIVNPASHAETTQKVQNFLKKMADPKCADASVEFDTDDISECDINRLWVINRSLCEQFLQWGEEQLLRDNNKQKFLMNKTRKALKQLVGNELAAEQGCAPAQFNLGICYYNGNGIEKNFKEAVKWYRMAAEQGYAPAQCNLGTCYYEGDGVVKNFKEAVKWYRIAAEEGYSPAQSNLGVCYQDGCGVEKNYEEAVKWYRMAAEEGNSIAKYNLGCCYNSGWGVEKNYEEVVKWMQMAADQGLPKAKKWCSDRKL